MKLPSALTPWASMLELFPAELALVLGAQLLRLAQVFGPTECDADSGLGEPEGFYGIGTRGKYDQLLISEWALAEVAPEEFLRRALTREQLFLQPNYSKPAASRANQLLLDCGPGQLGAPRIVHLACLILLAQRSAQAGEEFQWGLLQRPAQGLHQGLDAQALLQYLRTPAEAAPCESDWEEWSKLLRVAPGLTASRLWCLSLAACESFATAQPRWIRVIDVLDPQRSVLRVEVQQERTTRLLELELPEPSLVVRLLRDPFNQTERAAVLFEQQSFAKGELLFAHGRTLSVVLESGRGFMNFAIPNSVRAKVADPQRKALAQEEQLMGLVLNNKRVSALTQTAERIRLYGYGNANPYQVARLQAIVKLEKNPPDAKPTAVGQAAILRSSGMHLLTLHSGNFLYSLALTPPATLFQVLDTAVVASACTKDRLWYVHLKSNEQQGRLFCLTTAGKPEEKGSMSLTPGPHPLFFFAQLTNWSTAIFYANFGEQGWEIFHSGRIQRLGSVAPLQVAGVAELSLTQGSSKTPALVCFEPGKSGIELVAAAQRRRIATPAVVQEARMHCNYPYLAYRSTSGALVVLDLPSAQELLHVEAEEL